jgi:hypothetical protein
MWQPTWLMAYSTRLKSSRHSHFLSRVEGNERKRCELSKRSDRPAASCMHQTLRLAPCRFLLVYLPRWKHILRDSQVSRHLTAHRIRSEMRFRGQQQRTALPRHSWKRDHNASGRSGRRTSEGFAPALLEKNRFRIREATSSKKPGRNSNPNQTTKHLPMEFQETNARRYIRLTPLSRSASVLESPDLFEKQL